MCWMSTKKTQSIYYQYKTINRNIVQCVNEFVRICVKFTTFCDIHNDVLGAQYEYSNRVTYFCWWHLIAIILENCIAMTTLPNNSYHCSWCLDIHNKTIKWKKKQLAVFRFGLKDLNHRGIYGTRFVLSHCIGNLGDQTIDQSKLSNVQPSSLWNTFTWDDFYDDKIS